MPKKKPFCQKLYQTFKKQVLVSATSVLVTNNGKKVVGVSCIQYFVYFYKSQINFLFDSGSKVNAVNLNYAWKLGFKIKKTNIKAQKINGSIVEIFKIGIANFLVEDKIGRLKFFQKPFLVANTKFEVILRILFLKISNTNMLFNEITFTKKSYITKKALLIIKQV